MTTIALALLLSQMQDPVFSGPQKGEKTPAFKVLDLQGREVDCLTEWKGAPALIVFIHELTRPSAQVLRKLDEHVGRREGLKALIVLLGDDINKNERYAPLFQSIMKFRGVLGTSVDGKEGPGAYGLNRAVQLTILIAKDNVVAGNWAITSPSDTDAPAITKAIDEMLGMKPNPLEDRVAALEKEVRELRVLVEELRRGQAPKPERKLPGAAPTDATLNGLMRRLIRPERTDAEVDGVLKEMDDYAKTDELKKQVIDGFVLLRELKYGTEYAQKKIKERCEAAGK